ncbi:hypothetical protein B9Z55_017776 [Caenorhabditis nigoni]|uniref:G-protein coupled receptors family 1 profile domain-containing protein n=2 Tax=Caenorhabditis nigoni TaxID=1611254 RepID=A0A2G5TBF3_9PELO|nr:hypothetical protein B9Z55_017776 [Caenorhabditis nigoni]
MFVSAMLINVIAISFPFISMIFYSRLLLNIFLTRKIKIAPELYLFYCRFVFDLLISFISFVKMIVYASSMTPLYDFLVANHWLTFIVVWPVSVLSSMRAVLVFIIAFDRTCAAYFPVFFFNYRKLIPTLLIIAFVSSYFVFEVLVAFQVCKINLNIPTTCISAQCINGACYHNYWINFSKILYALIIALTLMLCLKIFFWDRYQKQNVNKNLRRANRLALIETSIIIVFNLIPPTINSFYPNYFEYVGAMNTVCQTLGFVVESWLTTVNMQQKYRIDGRKRSGKSMYPSEISVNKY